jgi:hypothetical protein
MIERTLHFDGPFSWQTDCEVACIFSSEAGKNKGIYLWTLQIPEGRVVSYVGETGRSFASRHREHLREHMAGFYHLFDVDSLARGEKRLVWNGMYGKRTRESLQSLFLRWSDLAPVIEKHTRLFQFFLAEYEGESDVRREIERELASCLARSERNFQDSGVWYLGAAAPIEQADIRITSALPIIGLPSGFRIGTRNREHMESGAFVTPETGEQAGRSGFLP